MCCNRCGPDFETWVEGMTNCFLSCLSGWIMATTDSDISWGARACGRVLLCVTRSLHRLYLWLLPYNKLPQSSVSWNNKHLLLLTEPWIWALLHVCGQLQPRWLILPELSPRFRARLALGWSGEVLAGLMVSPPPAGLGLSPHSGEALRGMSTGSLCAWAGKWHSITPTGVYQLEWVTGQPRHRGWGTASTSWWRGCGVTVQRREGGCLSLPRSLHAVSPLLAPHFCCLSFAGLSGGHVPPGEWLPEAASQNFPQAKSSTSFLFLKMF